MVDMKQMKWPDRRELCWYSLWDCVKILCSVEKFPWKWEFLAAKRMKYSVYGSRPLITRGSTNVSVFITHLNLQNHQNINYTSLSDSFTCGFDNALTPGVFRWFLPLKDVLCNGGPSILHWDPLDKNRRWEPRSHTELSGCPRPGFWERGTECSMRSNIESLCRNERHQQTKVSQLLLKPLQEPYLSAGGPRWLFLPYCWLCRSISHHQRALHFQKSAQNPSHSSAHTFVQTGKTIRDRKK